MKRSGMKTTPAMKAYRAAHPVCEACGEEESDSTHHIPRRNLPDTDKPDDFLSLGINCHVPIYHNKGWRYFIKKFPHLAEKVLASRQAHNLRTV
jgi:hypothetical protein